MKTMRKTLQRRTIYAATIVTILAMVTGFAVASLTSTVSSTNQNGFTVTAPGDTMYSAAPTTALVWVQASACTSSGGTVAPSSGATTANVYITGEVACQASSFDWFEEISFTSGTVPTSGPSDVFSITVNGNSAISVTVTYAGLTAGTSIVTTNIYYEVGGSGTAVPVHIGITGS